MTQTTRRALIASASAAAFLTSACMNTVGSQGGAIIDQRVDQTLNHLYQNHPGVAEVGRNAAGILVMPLVTEAGLGIGGSYGRGALRVQGVTVDYYSAAQISAGLQIGAQQYAHVLFFMTDQSLTNFRTTIGWSAGADAEYAVMDQGENISAETITTLEPVVAVIFGQAGLIASAVIEGTKYTRIIP